MRHLQSNSTRRNAQLAAINAAGYCFAGTPYHQRTRINPSAPGCNPPATVYVPASPGGSSQACSYDYMQDTEIYPEVRARSAFVGRATVFQIE